jgi:non-ribosomal peptide synthetase component E (peptide arylation enzyme)
MCISVHQSLQVALVPLVPPVVLSLLHSPDVKSYDLSSIRQIGCGGAPLSRETELEFKEVMNVKSDIRQGE